jgi:hypothetical protein
LAGARVVRDAEVQTLHRRTPHSIVSLTPKVSVEARFVGAFPSADNQNVTGQLLDQLA